MSEPPPFVSIVIAARPDAVRVRAAESAGRLEYPEDRFEILIARGRQPSVQRNAAVREARGELVYFLDDDSVPLPANLRRAVSHFTGDKVQMVGGPNLCPPDATPLQQAFALVMGNPLAFGPSRARYLPVGSLRESGEKELILCNLIVRKAAFEAAAGFDESLYPNEENALMDDLQRAGGKLLYDPEFIVFRRPRASFGAFCRMLMTYGRGRAEQFRLHPGAGSALNFIPPLFCLYLAVLPLFSRLPWQGIWPGALLPLAAYAILVLASSFTTLRLPEGDGRQGVDGKPEAPRRRQNPAANLMRVAPLIVTTHILYGLGFWKGLFTRLRKAGERPAVDVKIERLQPEGEPSE